MKRGISLIVLGLLVLSGVLFAQVGKPDGLYFAKQKEYAGSGWKYMVVLEVKAGKVVRAEWNGVNNLGVPDKKSYAAAGKYGMIKASKINAEWHEQAVRVEKYLLDTQTVNFTRYTNDAGNTDAISGVSIHVKDFFVLAQQALAAGPVSKGMYRKDGWYFAEAAAFDKNSGWKGNVLVTVVNGTVVDVVYNALSNDPNKKSKIVEAVAGNYGMAKAAKQGEWNIQAARLEEALVKQQDPAKVPVKADGTTDAVAGVSIHVSEFFTLAAQALAKAK